MAINEYEAELPQRVLRPGPIERKPLCDPNLKCSMSGPDAHPFTRFEEAINCLTKYRCQMLVNFAETNSTVTRLGVL